MSDSPLSHSNTYYKIGKYNKKKPERKDGTTKSKRSFDVQHDKSKDNQKQKKF